MWGRLSGKFECVLCSGVEESMNHIFFEYPFTAENSKNGFSLQRSFGMVNGIVLSLWALDVYILY